MTNTAFAPYVPRLHNELNDEFMSPQQLLDKTVVQAATQGLTKEMFQEEFHKNISASYDLQHHDINLNWDFDNGSVGLTFDKKSFMLTFQKAF